MSNPQIMLKLAKLKREKADLEKQRNRLLDDQKKIAALIKKLNDEIERLDQQIKKSS
jgi:uncharacterized membrane-anchored protein YhcB (DUF1043 family)